MPTDYEISAQQLRAQGVPITLLNGQEARLLFDLEAIAVIEDDFGSLGGMQDALQAIQDDGVKAAFFSPILKIMKAGLSHDPSATNARFDVALVGDYFKAVMKATQVAFPKDETVTTGIVPTMSEESTTSSPGQVSTTQSPSSSEEPTQPSGE